MNRLFPICFLTLPVLLALASCGQDKTPASADPTKNIQPASPKILAGYWIALDFCSRAGEYGSVLGAMNNGNLPYAYALTFNPAYPDSVTCFNGMETWTVPVLYNHDTLELKGARGDRSVFLLYHSEQDKDIMMFDPSPSGMETNTFIKSRASTARNGYEAFLTALNHHLFSGVMTPLGKKSGNIQLLPSGEIRDWKDYTGYEVCTNGDCFVSGSDLDIITLKNARKPETADMFGFKYSARNDTLTLYTLVDTTPEEKGGYKVKGTAFKFLRTKPDR